MRRVLATFFVFVLLCAACGDGAKDDSPGSADIRFIQASPNADLVDVFVDDDKEFQRAVEYLEVRNYRGLSADNSHLLITEASSFPLYATESLSVQDGSRYTLIALDIRSEMDTLLLLDDPLKPDTNRTGVRLVHAAVGISDDVDVYITHADDTNFDTEPAVTELAFKDSTTYLNSDADEYIVTLISSETGAFIAESDRLNFNGGRVYTLLFVEPLSGSSAVEFQLIEDLT
ncbi:MAG: DUF4397 domain-containing protein [Bdellovibrionales bacterium]|nr:DUF4397 domain-containing protein [Bdellovibrionales bacterium]